MRYIALIAPLTLGLAACDQPDEALPPEGELEPALPTEDMGEEEPEIGGEREAPVMDGDTSGGADMYGGEDETNTDPPGSKLQRADPDY